MKIKRKTPIGDGNQRTMTINEFAAEVDKKKDPDRGRKP